MTGGEVSAARAATRRAMRRAYAQGKWVARLKFSVLALSYVVLGSITAVMLSVSTMVTL